MGHRTVNVTAQPSLNTHCSPEMVNQMAWMRSAAGEPLASLLDYDVAITASGYIGQTTMTMEVLLTGSDKKEYSLQDKVPFGKHKGKTIADLLADHPYVEWLHKQAWFRVDTRPLTEFIKAEYKKRQEQGVADMNLSPAARKRRDEGKRRQQATAPCCSAPLTKARDIRKGRPAASLDALVLRCPCSFVLPKGQRAPAKTLSKVILSQRT